MLTKTDSYRQFAKTAVKLLLTAPGAMSDHQKVSFGIAVIRFPLRSLKLSEKELQG